MGRLGNQVDQFLGAMSFAKTLNRTLVVPPFRTYKNVPYKEWFKLDKLSEFHRIISAEDFMKNISPLIWPPSKRFAFCWMPRHMVHEINECGMRDGNPMRSFWSELGVKNFTKNFIFDFDLSEFDKWQRQYPADKYPVIALKGAPGSFPVKAEDRQNQKFMVLSDSITSEVNAVVRKLFGDEKFIGVHLRNGYDWLNACEHSDNMDNFMASPQCLDGQTDRKVTKEICFPSKETVLKDLETVLLTTYKGHIKNVYVATDKDAMLNEIKTHFANLIHDLNVVHHDPWLPLIDVAILTRSEHFIGNCVSSFTSIVKRYRDLENRPSSFWAFYK